MTDTFRMTENAVIKKEMQKRSKIPHPFLGLPMD